jgi:hypothetical protein
MLGAIDGGRGYIGSEMRVDTVCSTTTGWYPNSKHGMTAFQPTEYPTNLDIFHGMLNCNNQQIHRSIGAEYKCGGKNYKDIVFRSEKKGELEISARCVFEAIVQEAGEGDEKDVFWYPLAYLFTTNDPLNMDNFNYFIHGHTNKHKKCVEQLAFCEDKLKIGIYCIKKTTDDELKSAILIMAGDIKDSRVPPPLTVLLKSICCEATGKEEVTATLNEMGGATMKEVFLSDLIPKLTQDINLQQFKYYKQAGRSVPNVGGFLDIWNKLSLLCVVAERMEQLMHSVDSQRLVAGLIFRCIAEIRDDDKLWAYKLEQKEKLDIFDDNKNHERLHNNVIQSVKEYQDTFIDTLHKHIESENIDAAFEHLTSHTTGRLGLSERLIQSLWTKQIIFPQTLTEKIRAQLLIYGITASFKIPSLEELKTTGAIDIITSIGMPKGTTVALQ